MHVRVWVCCATAAQYEACDLACIVQDAQLFFDNAHLLLRPPRLQRRRSKGDFDRIRLPLVRTQPQAPTQHGVGRQHRQRLRQHAAQLEPAGVA